MIIATPLIFQAQSCTKNVSYGLVQIERFLGYNK